MISLRVASLDWLCKVELALVLAILDKVEFGLATAILDSRLIVIVAVFSVTPSAFFTFPSNAPASDLNAQLYIHVVWIGRVCLIGFSQRVLWLYLPPIVPETFTGFLSRSFLRSTPRIVLLNTRHSYIQRLQLFLSWLWL